eukprot:c42354_g1_i1 orf=1-222(+)
MAAGVDAEEKTQLEELQEAHKREALAYVCQLKTAAERQRSEDEELEATIKAKMDDGWHKGQPQFAGISQMAEE